MQLLIPIIYIWFGGPLINQYKRDIVMHNYPVLFFNNPPMPREFKRQLMNIEKADYYRLYALYEYGGIYSDFDNVIDYECIISLVGNSTKIVVSDQPCLDCQVPGHPCLNCTWNNFFYAPYPKMPILKQILSAVDDSQGPIQFFAGMQFLHKFSKEYQPMNIRACVKHQQHWSWFKDSNKRTGNNITNGRQKFNEPCSEAERNLVYIVGPISFLLGGSIVALSFRKIHVKRKQNQIESKVSQVESVSQVRSVSQVGSDF